ncbi:class I SAM-dependent methyltransferase [Baaleninema simplex]|uniref:class I SAM-dependent methyltransferase n=1 Tax=Baaleninema simplex TaxID=2862350 RepID=UPI000347B0BD|nr:methyltransferase domain-containing protein [Baaleninema simplex]
MSDRPLDPRRAEIRKIAAEAEKDGHPARWFEKVYATASGDADAVPWAMERPNPYLLEWLDDTKTCGDGKSALVIGCGLGDDAEALAGRGFDVTAFDISETAIAWCRQRFPNSSVCYQVCDLFACDASWTRAFDFVFESRTVQSLPLKLRHTTIGMVSEFVADGGTLLVVANRRDTEAEPDGPPWPLSDSEFKRFEACGLTEIRRDCFDRNSRPTVRVEYHRVFNG